MKKTSKFTLLFLIFVFTLSTIFLNATNKDTKNKQKLPDKYKKWLREEVVYIISQNEKEVFKSFITDELRDGFIKNFWKRRDPTPDTPFNEYREEHYRRIEYANKNFFEGATGWRTDRGRVYIMFGPPDFFESNPGGGRGFLFDPSGPTAEFPSEIWVYRYIPGLKTRYSRTEFTFINHYNSGKYQLVTNPALANALRNTSILARNVGYENPNVAAPGETDKNLPMNPLEQLQLMAELTKSRGEVLEEMERSARLRKLKGIVEAKASLYEMPFFMKESYLRGENNLTYIPLSVEVAAKDIAFNKEGDRYKGAVNFHIEIKDKGGTVYQSSQRLEMNLREETYQNRFTDYYQYKHRTALKPGEYLLHLVVWDEYDNKVGYIDRRIEVPKISNEQFSLSDVILARSIRVVKEEEPFTVYAKDIQTLQSLSESGLKVPEKIEMQKKEAPFTFGHLEINPNTLSEYSRNEELVFFYQIYSPTFSPEHKKAKLLILHQIEKNKKVIASIDGPQEVRILESQKTAFLNSGARYGLGEFSAGTYTLVVRVKDIVADKTIEKRIDFKVK